MRQNQGVGASDKEAPSLIVVGELNVDLIFEGVNQLPELEKERSAENFTIVLGSSSAILASNASAMGLPVGFVGHIGSDLFGTFVLDALSGHGVDTRYIQTLDAIPTGATVIYTHGNERGMITYPGAMDHLTIRDMPWDYIEQARHLHVSSLFLQRGLRQDCKELFKRARQAGLTTSLDTGWDPQEEWGEDVLDILEEVDVFLPNDEEARHISSEKDIKTALEVLASRAERVVITCGEDGVLARDDEIYRLPAVAVDAVDAVGAGDSFNAGFLTSFLRGDAFEASLERGLLSGAFSTRAAGGTAAFQQGGFDAFVKNHIEQVNS